MNYSYRIIGIAFLLRLIVWCGANVDPQRFLAPDSHDYLRLATELKADFRYGTLEQPEIFRAPGYPFFLFLIHHLSNAYALVGLAQILIDTVTCYLVWRIARELFSETVAGWALGFQCCNVVAIVYAVTLLSETLYAFTLTLFLYHLAQVHRSVKFNPSRALLLALLGIVLTYLRAITLLYLFIPVVLLAIGKKWREVLLFVIVTGLGLLPWYARNERLTGYRGFSSVSDINLYRYNAGLLLANLNGKSFDEQLRSIDGELATFATQQEQAHYAAQKGKTAVLGHPWRYAGLHLKADINNFLPAEGELIRLFGFEVGGNNTLSVLHSQGLRAAISNYFHGQWWLLVMLIPGIALLLTTYLLAGVGIWRHVDTNPYQPFPWILILTLLYFMLIPGAPSHPRFRVPVAPLFSLYAGVGMIVMGNCYRKKMFKEEAT